MADLTISNFGIDGFSAQKCVSISELHAGEALTKGEACRIDSDGKVYGAVSTETTISGVSDFDGFAMRAVTSGGAVTLFGLGAICNYAESMTPASFLYVSDTKGKLGTTAQNVADKPVAKVITDSEIVVIR
jgi:hypothetical protein